MGDVVDRIVGHPVRRTLVEALWYSSEPLSAQRFHSDYTDGSETVATISYHVRVLERDGVAKLAQGNGERQSSERVVILDGPNCGAVVHRLKLT